MFNNFQFFDQKGVIYDQSLMIRDDQNLQKNDIHSYHSIKSKLVGHILRNGNDYYR
jgi:hypothetical protein